MGLRHKFLFLIVSFCIFCSAGYAVGQPCDSLKEIVLETAEVPFESGVIEEEYLEDNIEEEASPVKIDTSESFRNKLHDVFDLKVSDNEHIEYLFDNLLTKKFNKGPLKSIGIHGLWRGALTETILSNGHDDTRMHYDILETRLHGTFRNDKTSFLITTRYLPQKEFKFMQNLFSDTFIRHRFNKLAVLTIGNTRTHTGEEGSWSELLIPFYLRSQISRQFGNIRKVGVRLSGESKYIDYDIALNSSGTYFREFLPGAEFCGWVNFKPLAKTNGKYGDLKIGGGLTAGRRHFNYNNVGAYIGYRYKKFKVDFEIANGNGSNGRVGPTTAHSRGYYTTLYYDLTKKIQLVARFDDFIPNSHNSSHHTREYSAGINYFIKGQALKLMLNYVFREDSIAGNSNKIIIGTQVLL